ncbi:hypothetical protein HZZ00_03935 [Streptomyces sp. NEAU-sy36]|uniref:hypothetical protein n=1 Tax=unclassified Streptomyces TaxID=2593676 RepID=UPI0015D587F3|nr:MULTISPECIES: hypothetical protein [unclassified Streptomyces]QLJ00210.1 hypothetical protein HZZ00_03935 [Streptomyces sp. NEAU-sy36]
MRLCTPLHPPLRSSPSRFRLFRTPSRRLPAARPLPPHRLPPRPLTLRALGLAVAAVLVPGPAAAVDAGPSPSCAAPGERDFPLATRIRGGPDSYRPGGGRGTWYIDLTNTTTRSCPAVHPVVVLVDDRHALRPEQARLDFHDGSRSRPVAFDSSDEKELIGVLDAPGFGGFTVPPGKTVSVRVRLALTRDAAVPDQVTAKAAAVQRRGRDGDWVGESNVYRFGVGTPGDGAGETSASPDTDRTPVAQHLPEGSTRTSTSTSTGAGTGTGTDTGTGTGTSTDPEASAGTQASPDAGTATGRSSQDIDGAAPANPSLSFAKDAQEAGERARELARTGPGLTHGLFAAAGALLCVAGAAFLVARGRR